MDLRQLQYFACIAESGSFREAAARANVAQSALSRHVRMLEDELGVALFERHARGVRLTPEGRRLQERAETILRDVEDTRAELTAESASPRGTVTIGASATTSRLLYGRLAQAASRRFPGIKLNLIEGASYFLLEGLETGRIDLAVMVDPEPRSYFTTELLVSETVYLIGAPGDADMPGTPCTVADLDGWPLVLFARPSGSRASLETAAAARGVALDVRFEAASPDVIKDFVHRGLGYGLMPHSSVFRELAAGELLASEFEGVRLRRSFIRRTDRPAPPAVTAIAGLVREEFDGLAREGTFGALPDVQVEQD